MSKKTAEQAIEQGNELVTMSANNALTAMSGVKFGDNIVVTGAETTLDEDGELAYVVTTKDKDGAEVVISYTPTAESAKTLSILSALREAKGLTDYMRCAYLADVSDNETWRDMGYRSFSEFCENFAGLAGNTARQYARAGHWFMEVSEDGTVNLRREFLKEVPITNLTQILALVKKICDDNGYGDKDIEQVLRVLNEEYIKSGKLHLRKGQQVCKDDMKAIMGTGKPESKEGKESNEGKEGKTEKGKPEKAVPTLAEALAIIAEGLADCDESVLSALEIVSKAVAGKLSK